MSLELLIYLADVVDGLRGVLFVLSVVSGFAAGALSLASLDMIDMTSVSNETKSLYKKWSIISMSILVFSLLTLIVTPKQKTIYSIAAIKMGREISQNEKVLETSDKIYKLLNQKLDEMIKEK